MTTNIEVVEALARASYAIATAEDKGLSFYQGTVYRAARIALKAAIVHAYPGVKPNEVEAVWIDCGETIAWCVDHIRAARAKCAMDGLAEALDDLPPDNAAAQRSEFYLANSSVFNIGIRRGWPHANLSDVVEAWIESGDSIPQVVAQLYGN
jgi:hypothetical protein